MKRFLKLGIATMLVGALVTVAFAFKAPKVKFTTEYNLYTAGVQPPTTTSLANTAGNWGSQQTTLPGYTPGTNLYAIEYNTTTTSFAQAISILQANVTALASATDGQVFTGSGSTSVTVHEAR